LGSTAQRLGIAWVLAAATALAPGNLGGQNPAPTGEPFSRQGFWIGLAPGVGAAWESCGGCADEERVTGGTFSASVGWGLSEHWIVAAEPYVWISGHGALTSNQKNQIQRGDLAIHAFYFPLPGHGAFARAGIGYGAYWTTINTVERSADGIAFIVGAGHDWRVSDQLVLRGQGVAHVGCLGAVWGWTSDLRYVRVAGRATQYMVSADFGLFFHPR